jgi:hypothetical protein
MPCRPAASSGHLLAQDVQQRLQLRVAAGAAAGIHGHSLARWALVESAAVGEASTVPRDEDGQERPDQPQVPGDGSPPQGDPATQVALDAGRAACRVMLDETAASTVNGQRPQLACIFARGRSEAEAERVDV